MRILIAMLFLFPLFVGAQENAIDAENTNDNPFLKELPTVILHTNKGPITIELLEDDAPISVKNFLDYEQSGFYDGTIFHRVIGNFMIQGGGFDQDFNQKSANEPITNEADNGLSNERGTVAMARTNMPHSATAQFFINVQDNRPLDHRGKQSGGTWGYAVFARVTDGMDVVDEIRQVATERRGPHADVPVENVVIERVEITEDTAE
ncbi:MAG: peptidylprolyl isomerase [Pseudomonadota bacterium]